MTHDRASLASHRKAAQIVNSLISINTTAENISSITFPTLESMAEFGKVILLNYRSQNLSTNLAKKTHTHSQTVAKLLMPFIIQNLKGGVGEGYAIIHDLRSLQ